MRGRGFRGGAPGGGRGGYSQPQQPQPTEALSRYMKHTVVQGAYIGGFKASTGSQPGEPKQPTNAATGSIYQYSQNLNLSVAAQNIGIVKLDAIFDELVKSTTSDIFDTDSEEEKMRKLNERNYNTRI